MEERTLSRKQWIVLIATSVAIAVLVEIVDRVVGLPEGGITPWILLGLFWIVMIILIWRERRRKAAGSAHARSSRANGT